MQAAAHEAFCASLAEAMACQCVPVVMDKSLSRGWGDTGMYVVSGDPAATAEAAKRAVGSQDIGVADRQL